MKKVSVVLLLSAIIMTGCVKEPEHKIDPEVQAAMEKMQNYTEEKETEPEAAPEEAAEPEQTEVKQTNDPDLSGLTMGQQNAIKEALHYLSFSSFSRKGLIDQLSSEYGSQFPVEDAEFAVSYLEEHDLVDWNEQAVKEAQHYLEFSSFSRDGLIDQMTSEYGSQFTQEQAEYAAGQVGY